MKRSIPGDDLEDVLKDFPPIESPKGRD